MLKTIPGLTLVLLAVGAARPADPVRLVSADGRQVVFELTVDSFAVAETKDGAAVTATGCFSLANPGEPDLPGRIVMVGLPPEGNVRVSASASETDARSGLAVRPRPDWTKTPDARRQTPDAGARPAAELLGIERFRDLRVARVRVNPARYDPGTRAVSLSHRVVVTVAFDNAGTGRARPDGLDPALQAMLVNGTQALQWKLEPLRPDTLNFFSRLSNWCRIETETTGVYRVTPAELQAAGFDPAAIDPAALRLFALGPHTINGPYPDTMIEMPLLSSDNGDARFEGSEYVAFYAEAPSGWRDVDTLWEANPFTRYSVYWLGWGTGAGLRMEDVDGAGASDGRTTALRRVRLEEDLQCPSRSGLLWLWAYYYKASGVLSAESSVVLNLPGRDTIKRVSGRLYGRYLDEGTKIYHAKVFLNSVLLDTVSMSAQASTPPPANFSYGSLAPAFAAREGVPDSLKLELFTEQQEEVFLDFLEVDYVEELELWEGGEGVAGQVEFLLYGPGVVDCAIGRAGSSAVVLDVTEPFRPRRVTGGAVSGGRLNVRLSAEARSRFWCASPEGMMNPVSITRRTPGTLRGNGEHVDYYIVCPDEFYDVAQMLARYRQGNVAGLVDARVEVVRLSWVQDDYGFGWAEPGAIKGFLRAKQPEYVLLAGDGTYDYRDILGLGGGPWVPAYETGYDIDPEVYGRTAKALDAWYADLEGSGSSPDLILGRVTARDVVEFRSFVDKLVRYESQPPGFWMKRFMLLADDEYLGSVTRRDPIGFQHIAGCEAMGRIADETFDLVKLYLTEWPLGDRTRSATALADELARGALFWCFYGHGAGFQICHEKTLEIANVRSLRNGTRVPVAFFGSCGVGRFDDTRYQAIAEELVRFDQGCIATVGATKATESGGNEALAEAMFGHFLAVPSDPVGVGFYLGSSQYNTLYHLFGDPATKLRIPANGPSPSAAPDTFYPGGRNAIRCQPPAVSGSYGMTANEETWFRYYRSDVGSTSYYRPGHEIGRGNGEFDSGEVSTSFVVPRISYPDTMPLGDGYYARLPNSCRVSILTWDKEQAWSSLRDDITLSPDTAPKLDNTPPQIALFADGQGLVPGDTNHVPVSFDLLGVISDQSGILLVPLPDLMLTLSVGGGARADLTPYFQYDRNSATTGRFTYPVKLTRSFDSLTIVASDNSVDPSMPGPNRKTLTIKLATALNEALELDSCLFYPNPVTGPGLAYFTFTLTRAAAVTARIYTLSGRLVRSLPALTCGFGFNRIQWDGLDRQGRALSNGVYLYRLEARATAASLTLTAGHTDKLIVHR